jgi:hypothetical protein
MIREGVHEVVVIEPRGLFNLCLKIPFEKYIELFENDLMGCPRGLDLGKNVEQHVWNLKQEFVITSVIHQPVQRMAAYNI